MASCVGSNTVDFFDCIILTETWCNNTGIFNMYNLSNYNLHMQTRPSDVKGGGVSVYTKKNLNGNLVQTINSNSIEGVIVSIIQNNEELKLFAIYRKPSGNIIDFLLTLETIIRSQNIKWICGDLNINTINRLDFNGRKLLSMMVRFDYTLINTSVTRIGANSVIDHIFIKNLNNKHAIITLEKNQFSDHNAIISLQFESPSQLLSKSSTKTLIKIDYSTVIESIREISPLREEWTGLANMIDAFTNEINTHKRIVTIKTKERDIPEWVDSKYIHLSRRINNIYDKILKLKNKNLPVNSLTNTLNCYRIELKNHAKATSTNYYYNQLVSGKRNPWDIINSVCGRSNKSKCISLISENSMINDDAKISDIFINKANETTGVKNDLIPPHFIGQHISNSIVFLTVDANTVKKHLNTLSNKKAPGIDGIKADLWKNLNDDCLYFLTSIINQCLTDGVYPNILKKAKVTPIHKKGNKTDPNNYRFISILPVINKVFERIIYTFIDEFASKYNIYDHNQYGFRLGSGTHNALCKILNDVSKGTDTMAKT
ncbi:hypothetical protein PVAND_004177 [Polypedilum vanderplanki]|uniref:Endonuclease/exonuclease/phosphatase domain-containing protein n=1 Tax=Polypedilum vanderplanki TaxID=319348 RepID=A0A9J6BXC3_POLVA|nr:hypothetical protein PVAND_004177 [Polypedilum vanderplanki]